MVSRGKKSNKMVGKRVKSTSGTLEQPQELGSLRLGRHSLSESGFPSKSVVPNSIATIPVKPKLQKRFHVRHLSCCLY